MLKSLKKCGTLLLIASVFGCATTPDTVEEKPSEKVIDNEVKAEKEKEPEWVTVTVDEFFISQETIQYGDGFVDGYKLYEYDDNGLIQKQSQIGSDESIISEEIFFYEGNLLVRSEYYSGNEMISQSLYSYNGNKQLVEESFMDPNGDLQGISSYDYDESGRKIKWISGDSGGIPMMYTEYEYDENGIIRMSYFLPTGEMEGYTQMTYKDSVLVEEATYSASSKLEKKTEYVYEDKRLTKSLYYFGKNLSRTIERSYDESGNVSELKTLNRNGDVTDIVVKEYIMIPVTKQVLM